MQTREDDNEGAGADIPARARATARVAPTISGRFDMRYVAGAGALALVCLCLLYIIFLTIPAHASTGGGNSADQMWSNKKPMDTSTPLPTDTSTPSPTVTNTPSPTDTSTPSPTVTNTPSPTVTNTPSPTVTETVYPSPTNPTTTPAPSPSATRSVFPSPTTTATVGAKMSPTVAASPGASPTIGATPIGTQAAGINQGPADAPTPASNTGDASNSGSNPLVDTLLLILVGLGGIGLLALLFIAVRIFLRRRLVPLPSPKLPPSGAAPWSRTPVSPQAQPGQPFAYAQGGNGPFYTPNGNGAPFPGSFNAAPTQANALLAGPYPPSTPPVMPSFPGYGNPAYPQPPGSFPAPPAVPTTNGFVGQMQNQQPFPGEHMAFGGQIPGNVSADMMVVSNPYLQTIREPYSQERQIVQQAPEEFDERW